MRGQEYSEHVRHDGMETLSELLGPFLQTLVSFYPSNDK